jgi:hypothetical protein
MLSSISDSAGWYWWEILEENVEEDEGRTLGGKSRRPIMRKWEFHFSRLDDDDERGLREREREREIHHPDLCEYESS